MLSNWKNVPSQLNDTEIINAIHFLFILWLQTDVVFWCDGKINYGQ